MGSGDASKPNYIFGYSELASARLSYQHKLMTDRRGYLLHPKILSHVQAAESSSSVEPLRILDLACGNGVWAIELARSSASYSQNLEITGLDINDVHFPPARTRPQNVTFTTWDLFSDVPDEYVASFDVVHVSFIWLLLYTSAETRSKAVTNMAKLLKSGGWLQWHEAYPGVFFEVDCKEDGSCERKGMTEAYQVMDKWIFFFKGSEWVKKMDEFLAEQAGIESTEAFLPEIMKDLLKYESDLYNWNTQEAVSGMFKLLNLSDEARKEIEDSCERVSKQIGKGDLVVATQEIIAIGRKP